MRAKVYIIFEQPSYSKIIEFSKLMVFHMKCMCSPALPIGNTLSFVFVFYFHILFSEARQAWPSASWV